MVSGPKMAIERVKVHKYGQTAANMLVTGKTIKLTVKEGLFMPMAMYTKVNGIMIKLKEEEHTSM